MMLRLERAGFFVLVQISLADPSAKSEGVKCGRLQ